MGAGAPCELADQAPRCRPSHHTCPVSGFRVPHFASPRLALPQLRCQRYSQWPAMAAAATTTTTPTRPSPTTPKNPISPIFIQIPPSLLHAQSLTHSHPYDNSQRTTTPPGPPPSPLSRRSLIVQPPPCCYTLPTGTGWCLFIRSSIHPPIIPAPPLSDTAVLE
jgi:hypothetical protein